MGSIEQCDSSYSTHQRLHHYCVDVTLEIMVEETPYYKELVASIEMLAVEDATLPDGLAMIQEEARLWSILYFISDSSNYQVGSLYRMPRSVPKRYNLRPNKKLCPADEQFFLDFLV